MDSAGADAGRCHSPIAGNMEEQVANGPSEESGRQPSVLFRRCVGEGEQWVIRRGVEWPRQCGACAWCA
jgi:hypothetical protein